MNAAELIEYSLNNCPTFSREYKLARMLQRSLEQRDDAINSVPLSGGAAEGYKTRFNEELDRIAEAG